MIIGFQHDTLGDWIPIYPGALLDFTLDWSGWLEEGDSISVSAWVVPEGLTSSAPSSDDDSATVWLTGVTAGETYTVINQVTTAAGRVQLKPFRIVGRALQ
ncbi:MAG: hypothetical protein AB7I42_25655 [Bradyrhizobium sp.]|uniref:phage fiber-tail adaptor protein n=1 Tax=Bradyrhizobium sp. TaxID=376 RepID=UPI003D152D03